MRLLLKKKKETHFGIDIHWYSNIRHWDTSVVPQTWAAKIDK